MVKVVGVVVADLEVPLHPLADQQPFLRLQQTAAGRQLMGAESWGARDVDCTADADGPRAGGAADAAENVGSVAAGIQVFARLLAAGSRRRPLAALCPLVVRAAADGQLFQGSSRVGRQLGVAGSG